MADERARPTGDERDDLIKRQREEIARLREEVARAERDRDRWKRQSECLKQQLDAARRAGFRQAAPFAKDRRQGRGGGRVGAPASGMDAELDDRFPRGSMKPMTRRSPRRGRPVGARSTSFAWRRNTKKICP